MEPKEPREPAPQNPAFKEFENIGYVDVMALGVAERLSQRVPFRAENHLVYSLFNQKARYPCDMQTVQVGLSDEEAEGYDEGCNREANVEFRKYDDPEKTRTLKIGINAYSGTLGARKVKGILVYEVATDGRRVLKLIEPRKGEIELSEEEKTIARLDLLKKVDAAPGQLPQ
ncbi:hypothetical protein BH23PAT1_BH23PAT1_3610 [soil metagenome]